MFRDVYECVLSEWLCCGIGVVCAVGVCGVDGSCAWRGRARGVLARRVCEHEKGIGWMPWRQEAMKDVARCENLGGAASGL